MENKGYDIVVEFKNYKKLGQEESKKMALEGVNVIIVEGGNGQGKTSTITAFREALLCKSLTSEPVTTGEYEGYTKVTIPDKEGKLITIIHDFDKNNTTGKFVGMYENGKAIKSVTELRTLLGSYDDVTVEQLFSLALTVPGRRKIIDEYLKPCLDEEARKEVKLLEDNYKLFYDERTQLNKQHDANLILLQQSNVSDEELDLLKQEDAANKALDTLNKRFNELSSIEQQKQQIIDARDSYNREYQPVYTMKYERLQQLVKQLEEIQGEITLLEQQLNDSEKVFTDKMEEFSKELALRSTDVSEELITTSQRIDAGLQFVKQIDSIKKKKLDKDSFSLIVNELSKEIQSKNDMLTAINDRKKEIFSNSNLPSGLSFDGDEIYVNGYPIAETSVSESEMKLAWLELKCKINTSKIIVLGNAAAFGQERLDKIVQIATENNKIVLLERVANDEQDVKLIGIVED